MHAIVSIFGVLSMVLDLCCMKPHDRMYALHIVSLHIHINKHAHIFFSYLGPY